MAISFFPSHTHTHIHTHTHTKLNHKFSWKKRKRGGGRIQCSRKFRIADFPLVTSPLDGEREGKKNRKKNFFFFDSTIERGRERERERDGRWKEPDCEDSVSLSKATTGTTQWIFTRKSDIGNGIRFGIKSSAWTTANSERRRTFPYLSRYCLHFIWKERQKSPTHSHSAFFLRLRSTTKIIIIITIITIIIVTIIAVAIIATMITIAKSMIAILKHFGNVYFAVECEGAIKKPSLAHH